MRVYIIRKQIGRRNLQKSLFLLVCTELARKKKIVDLVNVFSQVCEVYFAICECNLEIIMIFKNGN